MLCTFNVEKCDSVLKVQCVKTRGTRVTHNSCSEHTLLWLSLAVLVALSMTTQLVVQLVTLLADKQKRNQNFEHQMGA